MPTKLLLSGPPNGGKTSLLTSLNPKTTLVISRDGKAFGLPLHHKTVTEFSDADDLINQIGEAVVAFIDKTGENPETIVIDSISKVFLDIEARVLARVKSFPYGVVNTEIGKLVNFLENDIAPNCNIVFVSHTQLDPDQGVHQLVNAGGSYGKKGGILSEVDQAIAIEIKGKKRVLWYRSYPMSARTTIEDLPDSVPLEDYNLQDHLNTLSQVSDEVSGFAL